MTTQVNENTNLAQDKIAADNAAFEQVLNEECAWEVRQKIKGRQESLRDELFYSGVGTIEQVYEQLHNPGQGTGGYVHAILAILDDSAKVSLTNMRNSMNRAARLVGQEEKFTPEHAATRVCNMLDSFLFDDKLKIEREKDEERATMLGDAFKYRVRRGVELETHYAKLQTVRKTANRAVKTFGAQAMADARKAYELSRYGS